MGPAPDVPPGSLHCSRQGSVLCPLLQGLLLACPEGMQVAPRLSARCPAEGPQEQQGFPYRGLGPCIPQADGRSPQPQGRLRVRDSAAPHRPQASTAGVGSKSWSLCCPGLHSSRLWCARGHMLAGACPRPHMGWYQWPWPQHSQVLLWWQRRGQEAARPSSAGCSDKPLAPGAHGVPGAQEGNCWPPALHRSPPEGFPLADQDCNRETSHELRATLHSMFLVMHTKHLWGSKCVSMNVHQLGHCPPQPHSSSLVFIRTWGPNVVPRSESLP